MSVRPLASHTQHERPSLETGTERRHDKRLESERPQSPNPPPPHPTTNKQPRERSAIEDDCNKIMAVSAKYARTGSVLPLCCGNNLRSTRARAHKNVVAVRPEAGTSEATTTTRTRGCTPTRHCTPEHRSMDTNIDGHKRSLPAPLSHPLKNVPQVQSSNTSVARVLLTAGRRPRVGRLSSHRWPSPPSASAHHEECVAYGQLRARARS
jgi:hypothetical protein